MRRDAAMTKAKPKAKPKKRAMTVAERQAAYRARQRALRYAYGDDAEKERRELKAWIDFGAFLALARLARYHNVTKREMLERVIRDGQRKTLDKIRETPADAVYWDARGLLRKRSKRDGVTSK
jgi:hypothetical protein